ncbi:glycosyltransferase family 4 protein [candidate division KSB1 bacterium]|nr:glycosyltransferase family 4 protein [candidate division KSB1 bacterium]
MKRKFKIAYFNYMEDLYGSSIGSTIKAVELLSHLEEQGHKICYYWRNKERTPGADGEKANKKKSYFKRPLFRKLFFTPKEVLKNLFEMRLEYRFIKQNKPDMIIVRIDAYRYSASVLAKLLNIPLLIEADGANSYEWLFYNNKDGNIWKSWILFFERFCFRLSEYIFVQSRVARDYYVDLYNPAESKIHIITNGANPRTLLEDQSSLKEKLGIHAGSQVCGFMGSMHYWHNTGLLFELIKDVLTDYPEVYFLIVGGGGPMAAEFKKQCEQYDWNSRVLFTGFVEHDIAYQYVNLFDIALAPYASTGLFYYSPVKIFEYMAQGKAIITTKVGQITELIEDSNSGVFFDPDTPGDLTKKVKYLLDQPEKRSAVGRNAREIILHHHTWTHKALQLEKLCYAALKE